MHDVPEKVAGGVGDRPTTAMQGKHHEDAHDSLTAGFGGRDIAAYVA